ncbi:MAG: class I SAM-dependent methyltransferase [Candidatus Scalindua sp.]
MRLEKKKSSIGSWNEVWNAYDRKEYEYQLALEQHAVRWQRIEQIVLDKFGSFSGLNCIEIGAGSGHYSMLFARRGAKVTLLDYSEKALAFSKTVLTDQGVSENKVQFIQMDALKIDYTLFNKYDVSMSFGVAEHFEGNDRRTIVANHLSVLKEGGVAFISVPNKACIPFRIHQFLMKYVRRSVIEAYPFTSREFANIARECNVQGFSFIGSSIWETYNPISFYRRKKGVIQSIATLNKESRTFLDQYAGREITFVAMND